MERPMGTCSRCGGPVVMPSMMVNPVPHCTTCGAVARYGHGPVIEMQPGPKPTPPELQPFLDRLGKA